MPSTQIHVQTIIFSVLICSTGRRPSPLLLTRHTRIVPVTARDVRSVYPDFADGISGQSPAALGIDNRDPLADQRTAAADQHLRIGLIHWRRDLMRL